MQEKLTRRELTNTKGMVISRDRIERFQAALRGEVIQPDAFSYETARKDWNASIDKHPGIIVRCSGVADVVAAVNFARENELLVAVRGGGHNVGGKALCDDGMVIDLSGMKGVYVDGKNHTARVQGGATLGDLDRETHLYGLAVPAGVISKTGIAGLTLGGGVGWLVRKYGLSCDNVLSFAIVTADGKPRVASPIENQDLFWALRVEVVISESSPLLNSVPIRSAPFLEAWSFIRGIARSKFSDFIVTLPCRHQRS